MEVIAVTDQSAKSIDEQRARPYVELEDVNGKKITIINWDHPYWQEEGGLDQGATSEFLIKNLEQPQRPLIDKYMDEQVDRAMERAPDGKFDISKIKEEMEKEPRRQVLISLIDNYVGKVIVKFQDQKVVLIDNIVNVLTYLQQYILCRHFDQLTSLEDLQLTERQVEKIALLLRLEKSSTVVNQAAEDDVLGFEDIDELEDESELAKEPDPRYDETREHIFEIMAENQEIAEQYDEIDADKIKEELTSIRAQVDELKMKPKREDLNNALYKLEKAYSELKNELIQKQLAEKMVEKMEITISKRFKDSDAEARPGKRQETESIEKLFQRASWNQ